MMVVVFVSILIYSFAGIRSFRMDSRTPFRVLLYPTYHLSCTKQMLKYSLSMSIRIRHQHYDSKKDCQEYCNNDSPPPHNKRWHSLHYTTHLFRAKLYMLNIVFVFHHTLYLFKFRKINSITVLTFTCQVRAGFSQDCNTHHVSLSVHHDCPSQPPSHHQSPLSGRHSLPYSTGVPPPLQSCPDKTG